MFSFFFLVVLNSFFMIPVEIKNDATEMLPVLIDRAIDDLSK